MSQLAETIHGSRKRLSSMLQTSEYKAEMFALEQKRLKILLVYNTLKPVYKKLVEDTRELAIMTEVAESVTGFAKVLSSLEHARNKVDVELTTANTVGEALAPIMKAARVACCLCDGYGFNANGTSSIFMECGHSMCLAHFQQMPIVTQVKNRKEMACKRCPVCNHNSEYPKPNTSEFNPYSDESDILVVEDTPRFEGDSDVPSSVDDSD